MPKPKYIVVRLPIGHSPTLLWMVTGETFIPYAFETGFRGYWTRVSLHDNPYHSGEYKRSWYTGWLEAYKREKNGETPDNILPLQYGKQGATTISSNNQAVGTAGLDGFCSPALQTPDI